MLGVALSFGTSVSLLFEPESALAAEGPVVAVLPAAGNKAEPARPVFVNHQVDLAVTAYHTVEEGDSLWHIAKEHRADVQTIKVANGIAPDEVLRVGQVLRVPSVIESANLTEGQGKVHRLALSNNVRGSVGGDLSVVFGEELPLGDAVEAGQETSVVAKLEVDAEADATDATYELSAAALLDQEDALSEAQPSDEAESVAARSTNLPVSMPLNEVKANPLEELAASTRSHTSVEHSPAAIIPASANSSTSTPGSATEAESAAVTEASEVIAVRPLATNASSEVPAGIEVNAWQDSGVQVDDSTANEVETDKSLAIAALANPSVESEWSGAVSAPVADTQAYHIKAGDTLWNIASRHGLSVDELMRHNRGVQRAENLVVGDSINIPVGRGTPAGEESVPSLARAIQLSSQAERDAIIQDHLARIREAANREVNQEELKARIVAARRSIENVEQSASDGITPMEYHGSTSEPVESSDLAQGALMPQSVGGQAANVNLVARVATVAADDWSVTDAAAAVDATEIAALNRGAESAEDLEAPEEVVADPERLMAAAPMNPDVYRASPQLPIGEVVTPGMPILPDSGEFLPEAPNRFNGYVWPAQGTLTSGYGWRWGRMHRGIDIAGPVGTPILAAAPGVVVRSGWNSGGYGNLVDIRHADGSMTRYAHNSRLLVREGQQVSQGQQIAEMGSTGFSTGPHLHFEVHLPNTGTVNPLAHLPGR
jgi:murein DD-endopeptidase MepM/ murein hydrolase activator NlpD